MSTKPKSLIATPPVHHTRKATGTAKQAWTTPDMGRRGWGISPPFTVSVWVIVFIILLIAFL